MAATPQMRLIKPNAQALKPLIILPHPTAAGALKIKSSNDKVNTFMQISCALFIKAGSSSASALVYGSDEKKLESISKAACT